MSTLIHKSREKQQFGAECHDMLLDFNCILYIFQYSTYYRFRKCNAYTFLYLYSNVK